MSATTFDLLAVFGAAVIFRLALFYSHAIDVEFMTADSGQYTEQAESLASEGTFSEGGQPSMNRTPGYPALLALIYLLLGSSRLAVSGTQLLFDAATCVLVVDMALRLKLGRAPLLLVAGMAVTCAYTSVYAFEVMTETVYIFALTLAVWVWTGNRGDDRLGTTPARALVTGLLLGYATLTRPAMLLSALFFGGLVFAAPLLRGGLTLLRRPRFYLVPALYGLGVLVCVVPWMIRNRLVFADQYRNPDHRITALGRKSPVTGADHFYTTAYNRFLASYEQPYVQLSQTTPPVLARYVYPGEEAEVKAAYGQVHEHVTATGSYRPEDMPAFARIMEKRYQAAPRLHLTAPATLVAKLWITPRISVLLKERSGHNTGLGVIVALTCYSSIYLVGLLALWWGFRRTAPATALFVLAMALGHTLVYALWMPLPQARYTVVLYPLLSLGLGAFIQHLLERHSVLAALLSPALKAADKGAARRAA